MIYWLSIPIPVPTLGMVAWWMVIGCAVIVFHCVHAIRRSKTQPQLLGFLFTLIAWPAEPAAFVIEKAITRRKAEAQRRKFEADEAAYLSNKVIE